MPEKESWRFIGQRIRHLRKSNQLTIKQLANGCGLSSNAISLVERGEVAPTVSTLCKIAHALGTTLASFFDQACPGEERPVSDSFNEEQSPLGCALSDPNINAISNKGINLPTPLHAVKGNALPSILCVSGQLEYTLDDQHHQIAPGETLIIDHARPHILRNTGKEAGIAVLVFPPSSAQPTQTKIDDCTFSNKHEPRQLT